jgi:hypothetical protein
MSHGTGILCPLYTLKFPWNKCHTSATGTVQRFKETHTKATNKSTPARSRREVLLNLPNGLYIRISLAPDTVVYAKTNFHCAVICLPTSLKIEISTLSAPARKPEEEAAVVGVELVVEAAVVGLVVVDSLVAVAVAVVAVAAAAVVAAVVLRR